MVEPPEFQARVVGRASIPADQRLIVAGETLLNADYSGRRLSQFSADGARFEKCDFSAARIQSGSFGAGRRTSLYVGCTFDGAKIQFGPGGFARFVGCSFQRVDLQDWFCFAVELVDCSFSGRLRKAFFNGTVPEEAREFVGRTHNDFYGNDFSAMDFEDVDFRTGIDLSRQKLPSGPGYLYVRDAAAAAAYARSVIIKWDDLERRRFALIMVKELEDGLGKGQRQFLLRTKDFSRLKGFKAVVDDVFALLDAT